MAVRLTEEVVAQLEPPAKGRRIVFDRDARSPPGFGVRITAKGARAYVLRYRWTGADRLLTIRRAGTGKNHERLSEARVKARELRDVIEAGMDPVQWQREARRPWDHAITVAGAVQAYLGELRVRRPRSRDAGYLRRRVVPAIGTQRLEDLGPRGVRELIEMVGDEGHPAAARGLASALRAFLFWAEDRGCVFRRRTEDDHYGIFRQGIVARPRVRTLSDDEIRDFWHGIETCGVPRVVALALKLILVTGRRPCEVRAMKWSEIDAAEALWYIVPSRRRQTRAANPVPLSDLALEILDAAQAASGRPAPGQPGRLDPYVFVMPSGKPVSRQQLAGVGRYRRELGNRGPDPWRPADLRATFQQRCRALGLQEWVIDGLMNQDADHLQSSFEGGWSDLRKRLADAWKDSDTGGDLGTTDVPWPLLKLDALELWAAVLEGILAG